MLNILLLLAGQSPFFNQEEYVFPKPLVEINGISMIQHVIENLKGIKDDKRFICVVNSDDCRKHHLDNVLRLLTDHSAAIVKLDGSTQGAACSALMAIDNMDMDQPLIIANPDQVIDVDLDKIIQFFKGNHADAGVLCFETLHPRWSYVRLDGHGLVIEAAEKRPISKHAIAGFYYFAKAGDFVRNAMKSIQKSAHVNGVYYVSTVLNEMVLEHKKILPYQIESDRYHTFYSPQKIEEYQKKYAGAGLPMNSHNKEVTVVIPMAGQGSRFENAGYTLPKPFIDVGGKPMIARVIDNLRVPKARYILIARRDHVEQNSDIVLALLKEYPITFVEIDRMTEGAACTILHARKFIDNDNPLVLANCDQIIDMDINDFIKDSISRRLDGSILTFTEAGRDPKWSYAKTDDSGIVVEVKEKDPISDYATVGIYLYAKGKDFIDGAIDMIARNDRVKGEFYSCPVYNYVIANGKKIGIYNIEHSSMHGIGTPEDLQMYMKQNPLFASSVRQGK